MAHWKRVRKHGETEATAIQERVFGYRPCSKPNCPKRFYARGFCEQHYEETKRAEQPLYKVWVNMKQRCTNPKNPKFKDYGGRGIQVCERWNNFNNFEADMSERPDGCSLDRKDNDGNYEPLNCRWATAKQQRANQRINS